MVSATTEDVDKYLENLLWFAWKFVPLWYQQQLRGDTLYPFFELWFAWKFVPLWYQQQLGITDLLHHIVVICLKICTFVVSATTRRPRALRRTQLWFAWKFVPLWYQQQLRRFPPQGDYVVICLKICTFVVSATTECRRGHNSVTLWFAWKFVPLWYQQQHYSLWLFKIQRCDLLENLYLCGISNNVNFEVLPPLTVVICLKICTFVVSATTQAQNEERTKLLWFAWKFVPLWYQQQHWH